MKTINEGTLYEGWAGSKARTWHTDSELGQFIRNDLKKAGIKASVRFRKGGYLTSLTVTMTIRSDELLSFEEWSTKNNLLDCLKFGCWLDYYDESGCHNTIHYDSYCHSDDQERLQSLILKTRYEELIKLVAEDVMRPEALARLNTIKSIVISYNRDCTNSQIDYFDRDIYDSYNFKVV